MQRKDLFLGGRVGEGSRELFGLVVWLVLLTSRQTIPYLYFESLGTSVFVPRSIADMHKMMYRFIFK
jgi:hypothetical protein